MRCSYFWGIVFAGFAMNTGFSMEVSSIAIMNRSPQELDIVCQVLENTSFYDGPGESRMFRFSPSNGPDTGDASIDIKSSDSDTLTLNCYQEKEPQNNFIYRAKEDEETVITHGSFYYDPDYPGAFVFQ